VPVLNLAPSDLLVVGLFVALMLAMGFSARLRDASIFQFLTAGRNLSLPAFVASLVSTWYGGILGIGESVSYYGFGTWLLLGFPYYVFAFIYAVKYASKAREAKPITLPELLANRFGPRMGLIGAGLIYLLAVPAAHVLMLGVLVAALTGWPLWLAALVATLVGSLLLYKGGLLADVRLAIPAFILMYVGFATMVAVAIWKHPPDLAFAPIRSTPLGTFTGGQGVLPVVSFFILGAWTLVDPGFHQRVASASSPEVSRRGVLASILCWMVFDALTITTGLYAVTLLGDSMPANPLMIFPAIGELLLPAGLKGVFLCGMLGTIASAMVGYTLVAGGTFGREVVARLRPDMDNTAIVRWTRIGIGISCLAALAVGLSVESVVSLWYTWSGAVVGALLLPVTLAYGLMKRWNPAPVWVAATTAIAAILSLSWMVYGLRTGNPFLNVKLGEHEVGLGTVVPGLAISAVGLMFGHWANRTERSRNPENLPIQ
jgi:SSS family solute:Na+ symporter